MTLSKNSNLLLIVLIKRLKYNCNKETGKEVIIMKKTLLVTSLICSGLALGSLSENAKADETQSQIEAQGNQQIQYYWNQYQQGLQERQQAWEQGHGDRFSNAYITADAKAGAMYQEWLRSQTRLGDELHNYDVSQYEKPQSHKPQDNANDSTFEQTGGDFQADTPMGQSLKQNNDDQESSKPVSSQQLGLINEATWQDPDGSVHNVNSDGLDHYYKDQTKTYPYQDWSGALPDNAVIKDSDNMQYMTRQEYKQSLQSQQNNQQYGNGLLTKDNQSQSTNNQPSQAKELPQTGNANSKAGLGGLALASLTAMFALGKRKERY
jgi:LPXTG-motif cell wall-anchored protein